MKKIRPEAKIKTLPEEVQSTLWELTNVAMEGREKPMTYVEARAWLLNEHGVTTSQGAFSEWYSWYGLQLRTERAKERAAQAQADAAMMDPNLDPKFLDRLGQMVFTAETIEGGDVKAYVALMKLRIQERQLAQDDRRLALLEEKAAQTDKAKGELDSLLSDAEKVARMRSIFGM
jgi:hypothetical protein